MTSVESYEIRNRVCTVLLRIVGPYAPPQAIISYWNGMQKRYVRAIQGISDSNMLRLVQWREDMPEGMCTDGAFNEDGYTYVCQRIKSPDVTAQELSDLKKVKMAYEIMDEFRVLIKAALKGDRNKVNRILSRGAVA